jgi:arylsulfatase A-like enzyme
MLTGQYGHNNGVLWNDPNPYGDLRGKDNTLPVWLQRAGYRTAHIGKYLNNYAVGTGDPNEVAPGWDQWDTVLEESSKTPVSYYDYTLRENGRAVPYGSDPRDYVTRVLDHKAVDFIDRYGGPHRHPLFMALDEIAPHQASNRGDPRCQSSALPAPRDSKLFENKPLPMPPSFNEADVSDKPWFIRVEPRLTAADIADMKRRQDCRLASLRAVDRGVTQVVAALRRKHEMKNTAFLFTSDNGYLQGEHREHAKVDPYEEALHVPLIVRLPADMRSRHTPRALSTTVANIDIAPTILRLAGAKPCSPAGDCRVLDGRSLLKAIRTDGRKWPHDRGILLELKGPRAGKTQPCNYQGVRTQHQVFVRYLGVTRQLEGHGPCMPDGEAEHYNLRRDPYELRNLHPPNPGSPSATEEQTLSKRLERLRDCAGIKGRDPEPPSGHYCG